MSHLTCFVKIFAVIVFSTTAFADEAIRLDHIPLNTRSLDWRFGVTVDESPTSDGPDYNGNHIIDIKSQRDLGCIQSYTAYLRAGHMELLPAWWSKDDSNLLWQVNGKWGMYVQCLVHFQDGKIQWQLDVLKNLERKILTRTEEADPNQFLAVNKYGGFRTDSVAVNSNKGPLTFPVRFHLLLTSDPKHLGPNRTPQINSWMDALLYESGLIVVDRFQLGTQSPTPWPWQ